MDWHKDNGSLTLIGTRTKEILLGLAQGQRKSYFDWHKEVLLGLAQGQWKCYLDWHNAKGSLTWTGISLTLIGTRTMEVLLGLAQGQRKSYFDWHKDNGSLTLIGTRTK